MKEILCQMFRDKSKIWIAVFMVAAVTMSVSCTASKPNQNMEQSTERNTLWQNETTSKYSVDLPEYSYDGDNPYYQPIWEYAQKTLQLFNEENDVAIPCFLILKEDDSDQKDIKVWGDFQIYNYDLRGTTLMTQSYSSNPGVAHLTKVKEGYIVSEIEFVDDGENYTESVNKIFGWDKKLQKAYEGIEDKEEETRKAVIKDYRDREKLTIEAYQDYGFDPVFIDKKKEKIKYPDLDGTWMSADNRVMIIEKGESGDLYVVSIMDGFKDGRKNYSYVMSGQYEQSTKTLYYWQMWVAEIREKKSGNQNEVSDVYKEGSFAIKDDGTIVWDAPSDEQVVFTKEG